MTKLRYSFGGGAAVRQPCAVCTGAAHECSTEPDEHLPVLGGRCACNYERDIPATALAGDKLGADYRLYAESSGRIAPGWQYRRCVESCADVGTDADTRTQCLRCTGRCAKRCIVSRMDCWRKRQQRRKRWAVLSAFHYNVWPKQAHAHRQQVHGLLYVAAHRLTQKGVAV